MGCDIHMQVEVRVGDTWRRVDEFGPRRCSWCGGDGRYKDGRPCWSCTKDSPAGGPGMVTGVYSDRNYTVFSVLAGVRNQGHVNPIALPRGLPEDMAPLFVDPRYPDDDVSLGDHSFSWLMLSEVLAYDWQQHVTEQGFVSPEVFAAYEAAGDLPKNWCASVTGPGVRHITHSDMRRYLDPGDGFLRRLWGNHVYTLLTWQRRLSDSCRYFVEFAESLLGLGDPDDVRLVFGFDS